MFIEYMDDNPKRSLEDKLRGILALHRERYGEPGLILCHPSQVVSLPAVVILSCEGQRGIVRKDTWWVGLS